MCIIAGGGCLLAYLLLPQEQVSSWLPVVGVILVCLPWTFWLLTFIYRIVSRAFGFRVSFGGNGGGKGGNGKNYPVNADIEGAGSRANGKEDVQIGDGGAMAARGGLKRSLSVVSRESERALASSVNS